MCLSRLLCPVLAMILLAGGCKKSPTSTKPSLHQAARAGDVEKVQALLTSGTEINTRDKWGDTALHVAAFSGCSDVVEVLITNGAHVDATNKVGDTPLITAAKGTNKNVVAVLIAGGADIHARGIFLNTPLHWAAERGCKPVVRLLLNNGASVDATNRRGETPAILAMNAGHSEIVRFLVSKGANVTLHLAAYIGDLEKVRGLLKSGADVDEEDRNDRTALHWAAEQGHRDIVELLLAGSANPNAREPVRGATPLHLALERGYEDVAALLVAHGADVNAECGQINRTPLHIAASLGLKDTAALLLAKGANVDAKHESVWQGSDWTPLQNAVARGHIELVRLLLDNGAAVNEKAWTGGSLADLAMYNDDKSVVQLLLSRGADTSVHLATYVGDLQTITSLLDSGVDVNLRDARGYTALQYAAKAGNAAVAEVLIARGAHVNLNESADSGRMDESPLHLAAYSGNLDVTRLLLANGADVGTQGRHHWTPLHIAAYRGHKDIAELLLARGAAINAQDYDGSTPLYEAAHAGHADVVELFLNKGADIRAGRLSKELVLADAGALNQKELIGQIIAACKPYSIIVTDPRSVREYLRYNGIDYDELWIPQRTDLEDIDSVLAIHLQKNIVVGAMDHFDPAFVLAHLHVYNREYSGITREGRRFIISQMIIHDYPEGKPGNEFSMIHGSANGVVRFVFNVQNNAIAEIDCEFEY